MQDVRYAGASFQFVSAVYMRIAIAGAGPLRDSAWLYGYDA